MLQSLAKGNRYKMVADELGISIETVRTHIKRIHEKLHVHSVAEAIAKAFLKGRDFSALNFFVSHKDPTV